MTKVLILYYSAYGHMERMAQAVAEGVRDAGVEADIKRVPELVPQEVAKAIRVQARSESTNCDNRGIGRLRRDHFWVRDSVRNFHLADAQFS